MRQRIKSSFGYRAQINQSSLFVFSVSSPRQAKKGVTGLKEQKGQRTPAMQIAREAGPKLFLSFPPPRNVLCSFVGSQITPEAFSMMGEALTIGQLSH